MSAKLRLGDAAIAAIAAALLLWFLRRLDDNLDYRWDWARLIPLIARADGEGGLSPGILLTGLFATIRLALWSGIFAAAIGLAAALARTSAGVLGRALAASYINFVRAMPPLVFMFVFYFFLSSQILAGFNFAAWEGGALARWLFGPPALFENFASGVICLAIFEAAFVAEIFRGGINAVDAGQREAGRALGMPGWLVMLRIVLPQALKKSAPPLAGQFISLVKDSAIISVISVQELTFSGAEAAVSTGRIFEVWITVALMYFALCAALSAAFRRLERGGGGASLPRT